MATNWRMHSQVLVAVAGLLTLRTAATAQSSADTADDPVPPAYTVRHEGAVSVTRDGETTPIEAGFPLEDGDRLSTRLGRVEWRRDGAEAVFLDRQTTIEVFGERLIQLVEGSLLVTLPTDPGAAPYRIDTPSASIRLSWPGRYRVAADAAGVTDVATYRGAALVQNDAGSQPVGPGERTVAHRHTPPDAPLAFNITSQDALDHWAAMSPVDDRNRTNANALPAPLSGYAPVLSNNGTWSMDPTYGQIWYPNVIPGWRPYARGRWLRTPRYGYVWMGPDSWSWPTHHYGRWEMTRAGRWFWIPTARWAAAHVYWAVAPGYVAWSPLGWNGRPLVDFDIGLGFSSRGGLVGGSFSAVGGGYDPWNVWMVVSAGQFGHPRNVTHLALDRSYFRGRSASPFVMTPRLPMHRGYVVEAPRGPNARLPRPREPFGRREAPNGLAPRMSRPPIAPRDAPWPGASPRADESALDPYARAERARRQRWPSTPGARAPQPAGAAPDARRPMSPDSRINRRVPDGARPDPGVGARQDAAPPRRAVPPRSPFAAPADAAPRPRSGWRPSAPEGRTPEGGAAVPRHSPPPESR